MTDFHDYYEALNKLELVTIQEWILYPADARIDRPYIALSDDKPDSGIDLWQDSYVIAVVGHRGAGKTTLASALGIQSKWLWPELRIMANFPIKWQVKDSKGKLKIYQAEPLDLVKMVNFDSDYQHCLIILDECPAILNRMAAATNKNRILNLWIQQLRKNRNSLILCSQDFKLIDYEAQYQTDIVCYCKDASRRYPESGLKRGGVILIDVIDKSGLWTGFTHDERPVSHGKRMNSEYVWGTFDTYFQLDILDQLWRLELKRGTVRVEVGSQGNEVNPDHLYLADCLFRDAQAAGQDAIKLQDLFQQLDATDSQKKAIGKRMASVGCGRYRLDGEKDWQYPLGDYSSEKFLEK